MPKIMKDEEGLFVEIQGWVCRPLRDTTFKEGDKIRGSHPAGHVAYLRIGKRGMSEYKMEMWKTTRLTDRAERAYTGYKR